jgi:hypothetical protein
MENLCRFVVWLPLQPRHIDIDHRFGKFCHPTLAVDLRIRRIVGARSTFPGKSVFPRENPPAAIKVLCMSIG